MSLFPRKGLILWAIVVGLAFPAACGSSGVVGGDCSASYIDCNGQCVDAQNDPANCGGCARACEDGVSCHNAVCDGTTEGGAGTSGNGGASGESGAAGDSGSGNGSGTGGEEDDAGNLSDANPDGDAACLPPYDRPTACGDCETQCAGAKPVCAPDGMGSYQCVSLCMAPLVECDGQCVDPPIFDTPDACGACHKKCLTAAPTCSPDGAGGHQCVLVCDPPLTACNGRCVDFNIDPDNCGSCGHVCPSGICQGGMCVGAYDGNVVLACMNYRTPNNGSAQTVLLGNAVFLTPHNPVRILAYSEFASTATRANVDLAISYAATAHNKTYKITALSKYTNATATLNIANYDVFLIYDQTTAPPGQMATVGAAWQANSVVDSFAAAGGMVIALSGGTSEMDEFLSGSGLLDVSAQTPVAVDSKLYKFGPGNTIISNVISPFAAPADSCTFTTSATEDSNTHFVVQDAPLDMGAPVVVHRVVGQP